MLAAIAFALIARPANAWTEDQIAGDETRVAIEPSGAAIVEHRLGVRFNGNERRHSYSVHGVDADAAPLPGGYMVPERDAVSNSLTAAVPLKLAIDAPARARAATGADLRLDIDDDQGVLRGAYVLVFRYRTDLGQAGALRRDGPLVRIDWLGPLFTSGFDTARIVFSLPSAPTPPRSGDGDESALLSEVHRTGDRDEIELLRSYAPANERLRWSILADARALRLPPPEPDRPARPRETSVAPGDLFGSLLAEQGKGTRSVAMALAAALWLGFALLCGLRAREVRRVARGARAIMAPLVPLPALLRIPLAACALVAGVALDLVRPVWGALAVLAAAALAAHGAARSDPAQPPRGPGRWLALSEKEALGAAPRPQSAWLDASTRVGKLMLVVATAPFAVAAAWLWRRSPPHALLIALDAIAVFAVFGTGLVRAVPADLAVEPALFLRKLARALRHGAGGKALRLVPRIRIPVGQVDADELRLLIAPRRPRQGLFAVEVALTYALGFGGRVPMPEVLVRVAAGSPCDRALASLRRRARITPGRKPGERVLSFAPRLPTVHMTAQIALALVAQVTDATAVAVPPSDPAAAPARSRAAPDPRRDDRVVLPR